MRSCTYQQSRILARWRRLPVKTDKTKTANKQTNQKPKQVAIKTLLINVRQMNCEKVNRH